MGSGISFFFFFLELLRAQTRGDRGCCKRFFENVVGDGGCCGSFFENEGGWGLLCFF